nr:putative ABC transporter, ATP-binding protein [uncultured bacterium]
MPQPLIEAIDLTRTFGDFTAVDNISFTVNEGEIVGFLGPNGAGKTTTLKLLTGLLRPTAGSARIAGYDIASDSVAAKSNLGYVPDEPNLYEKLKAVEFLRFMGRIYRVPQAQAETHIEHMLTLFDLTDSAGSLLDSFSHGMQQKVAIAGALIHNPQVLFMDEPTVGLDPRSARIVKDLLIERRNRGQTVFFSSHILEIVEAMCDRVIIINKGRIIAEGTVEELRSRSQAGGSLEDIFLQVTGGSGVEALVQELG